MSDQEKFCFRCGYELGTGRFCGGCGRARGKPSGSSRGLKVFALLLTVTTLAAVGFAALPYVPAEYDPRVIRCSGGECPSLSTNRASTLRVTGTASALDRVGLQIPAEAAPPNGPAIRVTQAPSTQLAQWNLSRPMRALGPIVSFAPSGTSFSAPITVTLPYNPREIPAQSDPRSLVVLHRSSIGERAMRVDVVPVMSVDEDGETVTVQLSHFSDAVVALDPQAPQVIFVGPSTLPSATQLGDTERVPTVPCNQTLPGLSRETGYTVVRDDAAFWRTVDRNVTDGTTSQLPVRRIIRYLFAEDGGEIDQTPVAPLRTGYETALYRWLKRRIMANTSRITPQEMMEAALDVVKGPDRTAEMGTAMLTALNVVRILSRPSFWANDWTSGGARTTGLVCPDDQPNCGWDRNNGTYGHPATDPMAPIFRDLLGSRSVDDGTTLGQHLGARNGDRFLADRISGLFRREGGAFAAMPYVSTDEMNGGSHYYFFTGAVGEHFLGSVPSELGLLVERIIKIGPAFRAGIVQGIHFQDGADLVHDCLARAAAEHPGQLATGQAPTDPNAQPQPANNTTTPSAAPNPYLLPDGGCATLPRIREKCPWTPEGYSVGECTPGFCWDGGPQGMLACKARETPANAHRNEDNNPVCNDGFARSLEPCTGLLICTAAH